MFETRNDVICCSSGCRGGKAWHGGGAAGSQAISTFPRHRSHQAAAVRSGAKSRTVSRVRPVRDRTRAAHAARCKRGHRCQAGSMAPRRRRRRPFPPRGWTPTFLPALHPARPRCRCPVPFRAGLRSRYGGGCGRVCRPDAHLQESRFKAEGHSGEEQNAAGAMSEPEELRGRTIQAKTKGCADCPAMKGRRPWCRITPDNYCYQEQYCQPAFGHVPM